MPEIPEDLSSLSPEELAALERALVEYAEQAQQGDLTPEVIASLQNAADGAERVRAAVTEREQQASDLAAQAAAALERIRPAETPPAETPPAPEGSAETLPEGTETEPEGEPALAASLSALAAAVATLNQPPAEPPPVQAGGEPLRAPSLSELAQATQNNGGSQSSAPESIVASAVPRAAPDVGGFAAGHEFTGDDGNLSTSALLSALLSRADSMPVPREGMPATRGIFAVSRIDDQVPEDRRLHPGHDAENWRKMAEVTSAPAIRAAGGRCVPLIPYLDMIQISGADRPVRDSLPGFVVVGGGGTGGGISVLPPPRLSDAGTAARTVTDGATTNGSAVVTSATGAFNQFDVGATIAGAGIPAGTVISSVQSATSVTMTANATATATGVTLTITRQGSVAYITSAADAAALGASPTSAAGLAARKPCLHVNCPSPVNYELAAISRCIELGNFQARAFPEQEPVWLQLAMAQWAIVGETRLLDGIASASTAATTAMWATLGAARLWPSLVIRAARAYRQAYRTAEELPLHVWAPSWLRDFMVIDLLMGSGYDSDYYSTAIAQVNAMLGAIAGQGVNVTWYKDSGTAKGQYMTGANSRVTQAAGAALTFPDTAFWYMAHEGAFLYLDGGELDLGVVRDSVLNARNDYQIFSETFEGIAYKGIASWEFATTIDATGSYAPASAAIANVA